MGKFFLSGVMQDKVSIITGAGRGLGRTMALALAEAGAGERRHAVRARARGILRRAGGGAAARPSFGAASGDSGQPALPALRRRGNARLCCHGGRAASGVASPFSAGSQHVSWHVTIEPHNWARIDLRRRFEDLAPSLAFEISMWTSPEEPHQIEPPATAWR